MPSVCVLYSFLLLLHHHHLSPPVPQPTDAATAISLTAEQLQYIREWQQQSDYHNNYGCDFILPSALGDDYQRCIHHLSRGGLMSHQSGPGTDDHSHANIAWEDCTTSCATLFNNLYLLCATSHATDLLPHLLTAHNLQYPGAGPISIISFVWHYYSMGFVPSTDGMAIPYNTYDASILRDVHVCCWCVCVCVQLYSAAPSLTSS